MIIKYQHQKIVSFMSFYKPNTILIQINWWHNVTRTAASTLYWVKVHFHWSGYECSPPVALRRVPRFGHRYGLIYIINIQVWYGYSRIQNEAVNSGNDIIGRFVHVSSLLYSCPPQWERFRQVYSRASKRYNNDLFHIFLRVLSSYSPHKDCMGKLNRDSNRSSSNNLY